MRVTPPDLEAWLVDYVRACAQADGLDVDVSNKEDAELELPLPRPQIIIRDDSGSRLDWTTYDRSVGGSVLAGSKIDDAPAIDLSLWLAGVMHDSDLPLAAGTPIVSVDFGGCNGPYNVPETLDVTRRYLTAQYVVAGSWRATPPTTTPAQREKE